MSALTPHIRVLRALADKLEEQSDRSFECITDGAHEEDLHPMLEQNGSLLARISSACSDAADHLEAEEREQLKALVPRDMWDDEVERLKREHPLTSRQTEEGKP